MKQLNSLKSSTDNKPVVGKGATILLWSDRHAYEVLRVSNDATEVIIQRYRTCRVDNEPPFSIEQRYEFKELEHTLVVLKKMNTTWKLKNRHTGRWEDVFIIFGVKDEFYGIAA